VVHALDIVDSAQRGSGTKTTIAAMALAALVPTDPARCTLLAAHALGTDTDTIATMAAAVVGATADVPAPPAVLDTPYLTAEANRLGSIAGGRATQAFNYPDLLHWQPPRSQLDAVGTAGDRPALAGIGWLESLPDSEAAEQRDTTWQWMRTDFGASVLLKMRSRLRPLPAGNQPVRRDHIA
jgi:hypothetical protein